MASSVLTDNSNIEQRICDLLGINKDQGTQNSMVLTFEYDVVRVTWEGMVHVTDQKTIQALTDIINLHSYHKKEASK